MSKVPVALSAMSGVAESKLKQLRLNAGYAVAGGFAALVAAVFLIVAATAALSDAIGFIAACLSMSAIFACIALVVFVLRQKAVKRTQREAEVKATQAVVKAAVESDLSATTLSLAALAAGYALAKK